MQGAFFYSNFIKKAMIRLDYNIIENNKDETKSFFKRVLYFETLDLLYSKYLADPSFI